MPRRDEQAYQAYERFGYDPAIAAAMEFEERFRTEAEAIPQGMDRTHLLAVRLPPLLRLLAARGPAEQAAGLSLLRARWKLTGVEMRGLSTELQLLRRPRKPAREEQDPEAEERAVAGRVLPNLDLLVELRGAFLSYQRSDLGNAERLIAYAGPRLVTCDAFGWRCWDGRRWAPDSVGQVARWVQQTIRGIPMAAMAALELKEIDSEKLGAWLKFGTQSERASRIEATMKLAEPLLKQPAAMFDANPSSLNCLSGVIDLRTGTLGPHNPALMQTKLAPVQYDPGVDSERAAPRWHRFLEEVQPDPEVRAFLQRWAGYACLGVVREHILPIFWGVGRNGKGVFLNALLHTLGDYADTVPTELLMEKRGEAHPSERATLWGLRLACASETEEGRAFNVALVKQLTGGDPIKTRYMRKDWFTFWPSHKMVLSTNHRPVIREVSNAIWERVLLVAWPVVIPPGQRDPELGERLKSEAAGILRWLVDGCLQYQRLGLVPPKSVRVATEEYRAQQDKTAAFFEGYCTKGLLCRVSVADLRREYERWAEREGERPL
ncbi:MAG: hypothetical protein FJ125_15430, partial [Deltaproteobacteria bacterium]|nr:hypothetical protein [Deltaproteobacteria bacterium]